MNEMVKEFLDESRENLDRLDQDFVTLEREMADAPAERLASIFRTIHTIKGTCGFLGFDKLQGVTHVGENLLSKLRDGKLAVTTDIITALLKLVDAVREMLASIETTGAEGSADYSAIVANLTALSDASAAKTVVEAEVETHAAVPAEAETADAELDAATLLLQAIAGATTATAPETPAAQPLAATPPKKIEVEADKAAAPAGATGIRVDVALLDRLMNLVGELVLARNQIVQFSAGQECAALTSPAQRLNLITTELQEGVMKTRMQPIDNIWSKFPRIVRDLAQMCGKQVRVEMDGRSTELDKTIIEAIKDPLTHIIRNSVDHGIESPEKRKAAGKPPEGRLFLRAFHEGGQVNIEIVDDGGGIPPARVKQKAVEKGLITSEQAARMGDREAVNLIFLPGFSTAEQVTNVSGRGVGMDVVKTNIEKIGGSVDVQSRPGEGTTLRIKIPLTLAIIPALTIASCGERFAIPQVSLLELVRLEEQQARIGIERIGGAWVYRLRGNLLPLVDLGRQLGLGDETAPRKAGAVNIVVLQAEERQFGLIVDEINDTEEIVVKPLGSLFKGLTTFAGATIMGDGQVALILDVMGLAQRAGVRGRGKDRAGYQEAGPSAAADERQTLLLFRVGDRRRMAIPLSQVARLEEFDRETIESTGSGQVVQYRGRIMPLLSLGDWLGSAPSDEPTGRVQAIVYTRGRESVGLLVERIVDVVQQSVVVQSAGVRPGVLGSAVIDGRVTELLDAEGVIAQVLPDWTTADAAASIDLAPRIAA